MKAGARDAPALSVFVAEEGGGRRKVASDIVSVEITSTDHTVPVVILEIDAADPTIYDSPSWRFGNLLFVRLGYPGDLGPEYEAMVTGISGDSVMRIEALGHPGCRTNRNEGNCRRFDNVPAGELVKRVLAEYGFASDRVITEERLPVDVYGKTSDETDGEFLRRVAKKNGCELFFTAANAVLGTRDLTQRPVAELRYFTGDGEILSWRYHADDSYEPPGRVLIEGRDHMTKKPFRAEATVSSARSGGALAKVVEVVDPATGQTTLQTRAVRDQVIASSVPGGPGEARALAERRLRRKRMRTEQLDLTIVGNGYLEAGQVVTVSLGSKKLSGAYWIHECRQRIDSGGFTTSLTLIRAEHGGYQGARKLATTAAKVNEQKAPERGSREPRAVEVVDPRSGETKTRFR